MKYKFTKKELRTLGFTDVQSTILIDRTNSKKSWLAFDVNRKPDLLINKVGCTQEQLNLLRTVVLKDFPFDEHYCVSCEKGETVTLK